MKKLFHNFFSWLRLHFEHEVPTERRADYCRVAMGEACGLTTGQTDFRFDMWSNRFSDLTSGQTDILVGQVFEPIFRFDNRFSDSTTDQAGQTGSRLAKGAERMEHF